MKYNRKLRSKSMAARLNFALVSRKFVKAIVIELLAAAVVLASWCLIVEAQCGGHVVNVRNRSLSGRVSFGENLGYISEVGGGIIENGGFSDEDIAGIRSHLPFEGIYYSFEVRSASVLDPLYTLRRVSAGMILTLTTTLLTILFIIQLAEFFFGIVGGSKVIRKYLKPIDDIAMMAERLSAASEENAVREARAAAANDESEVRSDDEGGGKVLSGDELRGLKVALDSIDDSCKRIEVHDAELGGLEAAVNNMLRRLEEGKRQQIRFVDDASHELRTPIAVIQGYVNMLDRWGKSDPEVTEEAITAIKNEAEHMKVLIDQLLFLARGEMDRHVMEKKELNAAAVAEEICDESILLEEDKASGERHEFTAEIYTCAGGERRLAEEYVLGDEAMLKQAVRILRDNAVKYTPGGGQISFRVYERAAAGVGRDSGAGEVCIEVRDTGIGIPKNELPRIFDRFYRGTNARADNAGGSGLGLSIAKWIISRHGGCIEAVSGSGFGTKMTVVLPRTERTCAEDENKDGAALADGGGARGNMHANE